jgi:hypothetical protein
MSCKPIDVKFSEQKDRFCAEFASQSDPLEAAFKDVGVKGASAYEIAVMRGFKGTVDEWLDSLHGEDGKPGTPGKDGKPFTYDDFTEEQLEALTGPAGPAGKDGKDGLPGKDGEPGKDGLPGKDGYTPVKGKDYFDGQPGKDGAPGQPGADGYTPVRGTDYWTETDKREIVEEALEQVPSGGGGAAIIDVIALPTENIDEDSFYRLLTCTMIFNYTKQYQHRCICVDGLPATGEPVTTNMVNITAYYNLQDGNAYGYVDSFVSSVSGAPVGWYPAEMLFAQFGMAYGGVVTDIMAAEQENTNYFLLEYILYSYKDGLWTPANNIGWTGEGAGAEVFNSLTNTASGNSSHAEGYRSRAEGNYSHAEGDGTHAEGLSSHAEGDYSHAEGDYSHAEGLSSHAEGNYSHAEGNYSHAEGNYSHAEGTVSHAEGEASHAEGYRSRAEGEASHAEGRSTIAAGRSQHVQGEFNIVDPEYDENDPIKRGKYVHIVGNGTSAGDRSNAHTLDWKGNAWFAGGVELTSPNGTRYRFTVTNDGTLVSTVVTE